MKSKQLLRDQDKLFKRQKAIREISKSTKNWERFKISGNMNSGYPYHQREIFTGGIDGLRKSSALMVSKYGMTSDNAIGSVISGLNEYFKSEQARITRDYDLILGELSFALDKAKKHIPANLMPDAKQLFAHYSPSAFARHRRPIKFVSYQHQIPSYKFEMVAHLCIASVLYGLYEYALDNSDRMAMDMEWLSNMQTLTGAVAGYNALLYPALIDMQNSGGKKSKSEYVHQISKLRSDISQRDTAFAIGNVANMGHFVENNMHYIIRAWSSYERLFKIAEWMYNWRIAVNGELSGTYVISPVLELLDNALGAKLQIRADAIKKYKCISDYVSHRAYYHERYCGSGK